MYTVVGETKANLFIKHYRECMGEYIAAVQANIIIAKSVRDKHEPAATITKSLTGTPKRKSSPKRRNTKKAKVEKEAKVEQEAKVEKEAKVKKVKVKDPRGDPDAMMILKKKKKKRKIVPKMLKMMMLKLKLSQLQSHLQNKPRNQQKKDHNSPSSL